MHDLQTTRIYVKQMQHKKKIISIQWRKLIACQTRDGGSSNRNLCQRFSFYTPDKNCKFVMSTEIYMLLFAALRKNTWTIRIINERNTVVKLKQPGGTIGWKRYLRVAGTTNCILNVEKKMKYVSRNVRRIHVEADVK